MKPSNHLVYFLFLSFLLIGCSSSSSDIFEKTIDIANIQYRNIFEEEASTKLIPQTLNDNGSIKRTGIRSWTSGFFAGSFWYMYELTNDNYWKQQALLWTQKLNGIQERINNHTTGFQVNCSFGNANRILKNDIYKKEIIQVADALLARYNRSVGCFRSYNYHQGSVKNKEWFYPVVIDNMATIEILFKAFKLTGNESYKNTAINHAFTTMKNHYRDDYSCYHIVDYDAKSGLVLDKVSYNGLHDQLRWARGQAWGLYGFTLCYRETKNKKFLCFAENIASFIMNHPNTPDDLVPFWDLNMGKTKYELSWSHNNIENHKDIQDASAASIIASALFELSTYSDKGEVYYNYANRILNSLGSEKYMANKDEINYFILKHSVGNISRHDAVDKPTSYADYYFLEALNRKKTIDQALN